MEITLSKLRLKDSQTLNCIVNQLFKELDCDRIRKVMELLDWEWTCVTKEQNIVTSIPNKKSMKIAVRRLLEAGIEQAIHEKNWIFIGSGGFDIAIRYYDFSDDTCSLAINVSFALTHAHWWNMDIKK